MKKMDLPVLWIILEDMLASSLIILSSVLSVLILLRSILDVHLSEHEEMGWKDRVQQLIQILPWIVFTVVFRNLNEKMKNPK